MPTTAYSQAFDFNTFFTDPSLQFATIDSNNLFYNEVQDEPQMISLFNEIFPFQTSEFYGCASKIIPGDSIQFLPGLHNTLPTLSAKALEVRSSFTLNNKTSYWYAYYKKSVIDTTTAIVIFPGSGYNQSFYIAEENVNNYHNAGCIIKNKAAQYGDVYVIVKPNEDFRAIWKNVYNTGNYKKMDYDLLGPYTDLNGRHWAANLYIECMAQLLYLKTKYKKVVIMGLSNAGFPALVCGLESEVDGINCASGISVSSYSGFPVPNNENPYFSNLLTAYSLDSVENLVRTRETRVLFSYGAGDCCTNAYEYNNHAMELELNTPSPACNTEFYYNFWGHTFPCSGLDSFFTRINKAPKLTITADTTLCRSDSLRVNLRFGGAAPFNFDLYRGDVLENSFTVNDSTYALILYDTGTYHLGNIVDASNNSLCKSKVFKYHKPQIPNIIQSDFISRDCTNWLDSIRFVATGQPPYLVTSNIGNYNSFIAADSIFGVKVPKGNFDILTIKDASHCINNISLPVQVTNDTIMLSIDNIVYNCDSNKSVVSMHLRGRAPWTLFYNKDGSNNSLTIQDPIASVYFENGNYNFYQLSDSTNCSINLTNQFIINESPASYTLLNKKYICENGRTRFTMQLTGKAPWVLSYSRNGVQDSTVVQNSIDSIDLVNGDYLFEQVRDYNNCIRSINELYPVYDSMPEFRTEDTSYICSLNQTRLNYRLAGRSPWQLTYLNETTPVTITNVNAENSLYLQNGLYTFLYLTDGNGCLQNINQQIVIDGKQPSLLTHQAIYDCSRDSFMFKVNMTGKSPYKLHYTRNSVAGFFVFQNDADSIYIPRGAYQLESLLDDNNCTVPVSSAFSLTDTLPGLNITGSGFVCTSNSNNYIILKFFGKPAWTLSYTLNNTPQTFYSMQDVDTLWLSNGNVSFQQVQDGNGCIAYLSNQLTLDNLPPQAQIRNIGYDCERALGYTVISSSGNPPLKLSYTDNQNNPGEMDLWASTNPDTLWMGNGNYHFQQIRDLNGCVLTLDTTLTVNFAPLSFEYDIEPYNCATDQGVIMLNVKTGNQPYEIATLNNGFQNTLHTSGILNYQFAPGSFEINSVKDITGCQIFPEVHIEIENNRDIDKSSLFLEGLKVRTENKGNKYIWYYENKPIDTTTIPETTFQGNGIYYVGVVNENECLSYTLPLTLGKGKFKVYPNPAEEKINILIGLPKDIEIEAELLNSVGGLIKTVKLKNGINVLEISDLSRGAYILRVNYRGVGYYFESIKFVKI